MNCTACGKPLQLKGTGCACDEVEGQSRAGRTRMLDSHNEHGIERRYIGVDPGKSGAIAVTWGEGNPPADWHRECMAEYRRLQEMKRA